MNYRILFTVGLIAVLSLFIFLSLRNIDNLKSFLSQKTPVPTIQYIAPIGPAQEEPYILSKVNIYYNIDNPEQILIKNDSGAYVPVEVLNG